MAFVPPRSRHNVLQNCKEVEKGKIERKKKEHILNDTFWNANDASGMCECLCHKNAMVGETHVHFLWQLCALESVAANATNTVCAIRHAVYKYLVCERARSIKTKRNGWKTFYSATGISHICDIHNRSSAYVLWVHIRRILYHLFVMRSGTLHCIALKFDMTWLFISSSITIFTIYR